MARLRFLCVGFFGLCPLIHAQHAREDQNRVISSQAPLQASLLATLDVTKLSLGAPVYAKSLVAWNDPACHLRAGSIIVGHILDLEQPSKRSKGSSLTIAFDHAECEGSLAPFPFTLFAVITYPKIDEGSPMVGNQDVWGQPDGTVSIGAGGRATAPTVSLGLGTDLLDRQVAKDNTPATVESGQVVGIKRLSLHVGTGPDGSSILSSPKNNIRLEGATQLVLMPRATVASPTTSQVAENAETSHPNPIIPASATDDAKPTASPVVQPAAEPEIDETTLCTALCTMQPDTSGVPPAQATLKLSTASFGYVPHDAREFAAFDFESTLTYLDADNLLFTYDPHKLRKRIPDGYNAGSVRTIRAVLLDASTLRVKRMLDWQVEGEGQYIWHAGPGKVLVHLGAHLRLLDSSLKPLREVPLSAPLVFVSTSPSGDYIAIGTIHERHTRAMHEELAKALNSLPEEDTDVELFDQNFQKLLSVRQSSALPAPVFSDTGEIRVNSLGKSRWLIREYRWDHSVHIVAHLNSSCRPDLATSLSNAVFIVGCDDSQGQNWYRMIRLNGKPILNRKGTSEDLEQSTSSNNRDDFAIRVVRANLRVSRGDKFYKHDIKEEEVCVYRVSDGKRLFFTINPGVSLAEQSFALSPTGTQLAILSDLTLLMYHVSSRTQ